MQGYDIPWASAFYNLIRGVSFKVKI